MLVISKQGSNSETDIWHIGLLDQKDYKNYKYSLYLQCSVDYEKETTRKYLL